jgi:hypothetical protein
MNIQQSWGSSPVAPFFLGCADHMVWYIMSKKISMSRDTEQKKVHVSYGTVKGGKSEHLKFFKVILKLFCDGFFPIFLQKSWYQKFYFLFQDLTDSF